MTNGLSDVPGHAPVLLSEVLALLEPRPGEVACDLTVGRGGHTEALAEAVGPEGVVVGFDLDAASLRFAADRLARAPARVETVHANFVETARRLGQMALRADMVLADLGFSSWQMNDPHRGFSFRADGPLDMRFDTTSDVTAADLVNRLPEPELARLILRYGEEPLARKIALKLARERSAKPIRSTAELAALVKESYGSRAHRSRMHPATRTFMALRIAVNEELTALESLLEDIRRGASAASSGGWLAPGARVAIISFHSLEDRLVKRLFADLAAKDLAVRLTRRPITASDDEVAQNPRARSAKLRVIKLKSG